MDRSLGADERGTTPVVSKTLAIGIALLYVGGMTALLYGGVVPGYQAETGEELADRALAAAAGETEQSVPQAQGEINRTRTVSLPDRINEERYRIELSGRQLLLVHPDRELGAETTLSVPAGVDLEESSWRSGDDLVIHVTGPIENRTVRIADEHR